MSDDDNPATTEEVIFTSGTTHSINLVARSWGDANLRAGDEILLTEMEHHSNLVPWYQLAKRTGAVVRHIPLTDDGRLELDALDRLLTKRTKLVAVAAVSNVLGTINPLPEIIAKAHDAGAVVLVDAAQSGPTSGPTCRPWTATSWPSAATRCWVPRASACFTASGNCWRRCRRSWAAAA